jgi:hypothetical protein
MKLAQQVIDLCEAELFTNYKTARPMNPEDLSLIKRKMGSMRYTLGAAYTIKQTHGGTHIRINNKVLDDPRVKKLIHKFGVSIDTHRTALDPLWKESYDGIYEEDDDGHWVTSNGRHFFVKAAEQIKDGVLDLKSRFLLHWKKHWIINTKHGLERIIERGELTAEQMKQLFQRALDKFANMKARVGEAFLFFSKSLNQGFVSAVNGHGDLTLITFLPRGRRNPKPGTDVALMESLEFTFVEIE